MARAPTLLLILALALAGAACDTDSFDDPTAGEEEPSVAYKLAAIHGDLSAEDEFQDVLDCIKASGIEGGETEEQIGDTLVASWEQSAQQDSLLEWAQAFC